MQPKQKPTIKEPALQASKDSQGLNKAPKTPSAIPALQIVKNSTNTTKPSDSLNKKPLVVKKGKKLNDEVKNQSENKVKPVEKTVSKDKDVQDHNLAVNQVKKIPVQATDNIQVVSRDTLQNCNQQLGPSTNQSTFPECTKITTPLVPNVMAKEEQKNNSMGAAAKTLARKCAAERSVTLSAKCSGACFKTDLFDATFLGPHQALALEKLSKENRVGSIPTSSENK